MEMPEGIMKSKINTRYYMYIVIILFGMIKLLFFVLLLGEMG